MHRVLDRLHVKKGDHKFVLLNEMCPERTSSVNVKRRDQPLLLLYWDNWFYLCKQGPWYSHRTSGSMQVRLRPVFAWDCSVGSSRTRTLSLHAGGVCRKWFNSL